MNGPELCGNCAFPQNFYTRKLGEITVFILNGRSRKRSRGVFRTQLNLFWEDLQRLKGMLSPTADAGLQI